MDVKMENILKLIGFIIIAIAVVGIYDARNITQKFFGKNKENETTRTIKIIGFIVSIIGGALVIFG